MVGLQVAAKWDRVSYHYTKQGEAVHKCLLLLSIDHPITLANQKRRAGHLYAFLIFAVANVVPLSEIVVRLAYQELWVSKYF